MISPNKQTTALSTQMLRNISVQCEQIGGVNLGQGICQLPVPMELKKEAIDAIHRDKSLYTEAKGLLLLRESIASKIAKFNKFTVDPSNNLMVSHGATGAFVCAVLTLFNPGDEVILLEPFYPLHRSILMFYNIKVVTAKINLTDLSIDFDEISSLVNKNTKGFVLCNPCNPCGKVFSFEELQLIADLSERYNLSIISDEIYEYITYPGHQHISIATFFPTLSNVITISGFSKTFSMTGWRLGYASGPALIIDKMSLVQDLLYVCPVTPFQHALINAYACSETYFSNIQHSYFKKVNLVVSVLQELKIKPITPQGAYYILADCSELPLEPMETASEFLLHKVKIGTVPGDVFFTDFPYKQSYVRICVAHELSILERAIQQLRTAKLLHPKPKLYRTDI